MTDLVRVKRGRAPWVTEPESGGGGGGGDLDATLAAGNDAGGQGITNLADGQSAQDAATVHNIDQTLGFVTLNLTLSNDPDAGGIAVKNIGDGVDPQDAATVGQVDAVGPDSGQVMPTAIDDATVSTGTIPDAVGDAGFLRTLMLPAGESVGLAVAVEGDTHARMILFVPEEGGCYVAFGDGTIEPYDTGAWVGYDPNAGNPGLAGLYLFGGSVRIDSTQILYSGLPESDPLVAGQLWSSSGTVKISAGP